jgi:hypothetical protein
MKESCTGAKTSMTTFHNNYVSIFVCDERGKPFDVSQLKVELPPISSQNCSRGEYDGSHPQPYVLTADPDTHTEKVRELIGKDEKHDPVQRNEIRFLFHAGRSQKKYVAIDYMNQGHVNSALPSSNQGHDDVEWPDAEIDLGGSAMRSASMSAKGDHEAPHKLNFYFPVKITTKGGMVLDLLLAQSGPAHGLLKRLYHIGKAVEHAVKAGVQYYEGDEEEALENTQKFAKDLKTISKENHNLWYVTVKGTEDWPAVAVDKHKIGKRVKNSLVFTGPIGAASSPDKIQSARFYYYSENPPANHHYYTFSLTLYDERPFRPRLPEEDAETRILFLDEKDHGLYRYRLNETDRSLVGNEVPFVYNYGSTPLRNVFAEGDVICYFSYTSDRDKEPRYEMVVRYQAQGVWQEKKFDGVRAEPVIHKGKVYFSQDRSPVTGAINGIYCFDPSSPSKPAVLVVKGRSAAQASVRRPTRLAIPPDSDFLYYLAPGGDTFKEQYYALHRFDLVRGVDEVIQRPSTEYGLADTQFVVCKGYVYFADNHSLYRRRADGSGEAQLITKTPNLRSGGRDNDICASPGGEYIFFQCIDPSSIWKVSTSDPARVTEIWRNGGNIAAVSNRLIFIDTGNTSGATAIDFVGKAFYDLRRRQSVSSAGDGDERKLTSSDPLQHPFVLNEQLFGTIGKPGDRYHLVRGDIPKDVKEETRINFRYVCDGYEVVAASQVARFGLCHHFGLLHSPMWSTYPILPRMSSSAVKP